MRPLSGPSLRHPPGWIDFYVEVHGSPVLSGGALAQAAVCCRSSLSVFKRPNTIRELLHFTLKIFVFVHVRVFVRVLMSIWFVPTITLESLHRKMFVDTISLERLSQSEPNLHI